VVSGPYGGDASLYLEEILGEEVAAPLGGWADAGTAHQVELIGLHLRLSGLLNTGHFRRLSDFVNNQEGLLRIRDALVLRRNGDPTRVSMPDVWISPPEVTLIAEIGGSAVGAAPDFFMRKEPVGVIVVTPGHTLTGEVQLTPGAELSVFIESPEPPFIPLMDVRTRSLADRRIISRYSFALLNRRHIVAASPLPEGLVRGDRVL
jgi:hypothetical protein